MMQMGYGVVAGQQGTANKVLLSASTQATLRDGKQTLYVIVIGESSRLIVRRPPLESDGFVDGPSK
jgi:glucan phosphoethanolaminetransferase (alkaline phosphatase superfamily)